MDTRTLAEDVWEVLYEDKKLISIRLPKNLFNAIGEVAVAREKTVSDIIRLSLELYLFPFMAEERIKSIEKALKGSIESGKPYLSLLSALVSEAQLAIERTGETMEYLEDRAKRIEILEGVVRDTINSLKEGEGKVP